ncbi:MAG: NAD(+) diphosphatase [Albidovulum sp.]
MYDDALVTFANGGIDRAGHLRSDEAGLTALLATPKAVCLPVWRGRPLMRAEAAGWLAADHPVFADTAGEPMFLGLADGRAYFARDLSDWAPEEGIPPQAGGFWDMNRQIHPAIDPEYGFADLRTNLAGLSARDAELLAMAKGLIGWHDSHRFCARCGAPSAVIMGGWQRQCGACNAMHFPRTDPVVIMLVTHGNNVLLGRSPGWPEGMFSLLAGFVEPGETLEAAVRREVAEEAGVKVGPVQYLACQPWPFPASLMIGCSGQAQSTDITIDPQEIEQAIWVSREDMALVASGQHPDIRPPRREAIAGYMLLEWLAGRMV